MYFKFFKLQSWDKRSASYRRRLIQRFLQGMGFPIPGLRAYIRYASLLLEEKVARSAE